ncbi:MAG: hypothetical protein WC011_02490 [Candidatus Paceibacterota bacterium]
MENYIEDVVNQLIEDALEVKSKAVDDSTKGVLLGYYLCISSILNQATAFGVHDKLSKKLQEFVPESLINPK